MADVDEVVILSEDGGASDDPRITCDACFARKDAYKGDIVNAARRHGVTAVHVQHAPDILGVGSELLGLLAALRDAGIRTVITLHTVFTPWSGLIECKPFTRSFHRKLGQVADRIVVHTATSRRLLVDQGLPADRIALLPHGTDAFAEGDPEAGRDFLGTSACDQVILFFGFIHMQKNIQVVIRALPALTARVSEAILVVAGKIGDDVWYNRLYLRWLQRLARRHGVADRVRFLIGFVPEERIADIHAAARVVALPYAQGYASASGVVHGAMALRVPMVCSAGPKFEEVAEHIDEDLLVGPDDVAGWARTLERVTVDEAYRSQVVERSDAFAEKTVWSAIATQSAKLYV